jgi:hypothetical protein
MVNLLRIFNRYKMKAKELQTENEQLKAQIVGLSFRLQESEGKHAMFLDALQSYKARVDDLENEIRLIRLSNQAAKQYSDNDKNY